MRYRKTLSLVAILLVLLQTTGCKSFQPMRTRLPSAADQAESRKTTRITLADGDKLRFRGAWSDGEVVQGLDVSNRGFQVRDVKIPWSDVVKLEEKRFSLGYTVIGIGATYLLLGLAVVASGGLDLDWSSSGGGW